MVFWIGKILLKTRPNSDVVFLTTKNLLSIPKKRSSQPNHEDELVEDVIDVETGVEVAKENKRGRSKKLKTELEKEKPKKRGRPPKSKK
ncbi:hypothetical protein BpHYR1_044875 [Brachionus plicatilis]|uniref:Uncharacterized protein n=1 Tax=Brachionus plicatilis TaxID=10195 RepID=A0A3M7R249_BRAPC|nr:hypothetical protein BpHYR1_044875 [Brachionus plicatilis]